MTVKEEFQSIGKKLDEIRELLVNGPQSQDAEDLGQSETADDDAEIVDDEMANEVGRLREELRRSREAQETLRSERDHFIERAKEQGARLSQAQDQRDELQRWVGQLQAERPQEDLVTIPAEEFDDLRNAKKERDTLRDANTELGEQRDQLNDELRRARFPQGGDRQQLDQAREEIYKLREQRDAFKNQANKLARERDQESARADKAERQREQLMSELVKIREERGAEREEVQGQTARAEKAEELAEKARDTLHNIHGTIHEELE